MDLNHPLVARNEPGTKFLSKLRSVLPTMSPCLRSLSDCHLFGPCTLFPSVPVPFALPESWFLGFSPIGIFGFHVQGDNSIPRHTAALWAQSGQGFFPLCQLRLYPSFALVRVQRSSWMAPVKPGEGFRCPVFPGASVRGLSPAPLDP